MVLSAHIEPPVAKVIGHDFELSNAILGQRHGGGRVDRAASFLLREISGYPRRSRGGTAIESGRRFLATSGGSWYIDSDHLEGNLPEHMRALEHPQILHGAGLRQARLAQAAAAGQLPAGTRLNVAANCSDGRTAWGSHLNVLVTRSCFDNLLFRKPHLASFFSTHLVTSVLYTGQGLVGPANGRSPCDFQLSQRADWFEQMTGQQTMYQRPLLNLRDEAHASADLARLHIIYFDMVLAPVANILKAGTTQLVLSMIEQGWINPGLCLDDPVLAASEVSRDLQLRTPLRTVVRGRSLTAVEIQFGIAELAGEFVDEGLADGLVPDAPAIVKLWRETIELLRGREIDALAGRCDAWLKYLLLDRQRGRRGLAWDAAELKVLDSLFASLEPESSLFFQVAADGGVERMPSEDEIKQALHQPPTDTRAYFRAHTLRRFGEFVSSMDWDQISFRVPSRRHWWSVASVPMPDPRRLTAQETETILAQTRTLEELVEAANGLELEPRADWTMTSANRGGSGPSLT